MDDDEKPQTLRLRRPSGSIARKPSRSWSSGARPSIVETPPTNKETVFRLAEGTEKLLHEVKRLRVDLVRLTARFKPLEEDDEYFLEEPSFIKRPAPWTAEDAINVLNSASEYIFNSERLLNMIRGKMDAIEADAVSRSDYKTWLKE